MTGIRLVYSKPLGDGIAPSRRTLPTSSIDLVESQQILRKNLTRLHRLRPGAVAVIERLVDDFLADG